MAAPAVVQVRPGVTFTPAAAQSFRRMEAEAGRQIDVNSTYRDWNKQYELWTTWVVFNRNKQLWRRLHPGQPDPPRALHPDASMHCKALAMDTDDVSLLRSLADHGWRRTAPDEDWHHEYQQWNDKHFGEPAGGGSIPFPQPEPTPEPPVVEEEDDMKNSGFFYTRTADGKTVFLLVNTVGRWWMEYLLSTTIGQSNNGIAGQFETGQYVEVTNDWANALKASIDRASNVTVKAPPVAGETEA